MKASILVLYEDDECFVVDKPPGIAVNETHTLRTPSLVSQFRSKGAKAVHRLDRDTTGVMVFAKTKKSAARLSTAFAQRRVSKLYIAVAEGRPENGVVDCPIGQDRRRPRARMVRADGQSALTALDVLVAEPGYSLVRARPETGRTHQIRVHLAHGGHPILGDLLYGGPAAIRVEQKVLRLERYLLHALALKLPVGGQERSFVANPPHDFAPFLRGLTATEIVNS